MNRNALSIALALGLAAGVGVAPVCADEPSPGGTGARAEASPVRPASPGWFDTAPEGGVAPIDGPTADAFGESIVARGRRSLTEERALADARARLEAAVSDWLAPEVPEGWEPPAGLVDALVLDRHVEPVPVDFRSIGLADDPDLTLPEVLHVAALRADLSPDRRGPLLDAYRREVGSRRLEVLGGVGGFVLSCLAILVLYIRSDEATRGYYTNRLRLAAVASAGAAGAAIYRLLA